MSATGALYLGTPGNLGSTGTGTPNRPPSINSGPPNKITPIIYNPQTAGAANNYGYSFFPQTVNPSSSSQGQGYDPSYLQNLATYIGGLFSRPNGNLSFNPTGNLNDVQSQQLGYGNAPLFGLPNTLLQNAINTSLFTNPSGVTPPNVAPAPATAPTTPVPTPFGYSNPGDVAPTGSDIQQYYSGAI